MRGIVRYDCGVRLKFLKSNTKKVSCDEERKYQSVNLIQVILYT